MYRLSLSAFLLSTALFAGAQQYVHQVLVLNEGHFNWTDQQQEVPVSLGSYDPASGSYSTVATIDGSRFASDVEVDGQYIFVAADTRILKFDKETYTLVDEVEVIGVRKLAIHEDKLLITRGELGGLPHYFEIRNTSDLQLITAITPDDGLPHSIEDVVVANGKAWLGVNNSFDWMNITGYVAVFDLATMTLGAPIDLGPAGLNPEKLMVTGNEIYVLNNTDFTSSSISKISQQAATLQQTITVATNSGCGASALAGGEQKVYFMEYAVNTLARYDILTDQVTDTLNNQISAYGLIDDAINGVMYVTTTDFFSSGELYVMQYDGATSAPVSVGVSPGHLALDVRTSTSINERDLKAPVLSPNPATENLRINGIEGDRADILITDALGRTVYTLLQAVAGSQVQLDIAGLTSGVYLLKVNNGPAVRFSKQ